MTQAVPYYSSASSVVLATMPPQSPMRHATAPGSFMQSQQPDSPGFRSGQHAAPGSMALETLDEDATVHHGMTQAAAGTDDDVLMLGGLPGAAFAVHATGVDRVRRGTWAGPESRASAPGIAPTPQSPYSPMAYGVRQKGAMHFFNTMSETGVAVTQQLGGGLEGEAPDLAG